MRLYSVLFLCIIGCNFPHNDITPEAAAVKWTSDMGLKVQGHPNCTQIDSDSDGYVTYTIALMQADMPVKLLSLQCAVVTSRGCEYNNGTICSRV